MKVTTDSCFFGAWIAEAIRNSELKVGSILDIGTGTGLLSLMVAQKNAIRIDAVEIDIDAATQAKENINGSPWSKSIQVFNEDVLMFWPNKKYDCIICNPPFYENELTSGHAKKNIAHHSSQLTISQALNITKNNLNAGGLFFLMYPFKREQEIDQLLLENKLYIVKSVSLKQSLRHPPFRTMIMGTTTQTDPESRLTVAVWNEGQQYTDQFRNFLKDYYLYL